MTSWEVEYLGKESRTVSLYCWSEDFRSFGVARVWRILSKGHVYKTLKDMLWDNRLLGRTPKGCQLYWFIG